MKIAISYPPLESDKGTPLLAQNRQFQWFSDPTYIYPMIPASAATLLEESGYEVFWDDAIAEGLSYKAWKERLIREKPDIVVIETKTPVVKTHWRIIEDIKKESLKISAKGGPASGWENLKIVLMGDHVTALPEESMKKSKVDYVICGGDYDFILKSIADKLSGRGEFEGGVWYRDRDKIITSGKYDLKSHTLYDLPQIDRILTRWKLYAYKNGNFKNTPGTYVMNARDCWWGRCSFCSWTTLFPGEKFRARTVRKALDEIGDLIKLGAREIMEDSGTLPIGEWLAEFCDGMIERGYNKKVILDCNMRINAIKDPKVWQLMKKAGFRMILFGIESANQETLDRLNKNLHVPEIEPALKSCSGEGLEPHVTFMLGYPWETNEDAKKTIHFAKKLFRLGYIHSLQATIAIPYPGTPLYDYCQKNNLLLTDNYDDFDQRKLVMKSALTNEDAKTLIGDLYRSFMGPKFILRKLAGIRSWNDAKFLARAGKKVAGHLKDFQNKNPIL